MSSNNLASKQLLPLRPRRATIRDVARRAGVSAGTVSNAMNNSSLVAPHTLERIRGVMRELNFSPNALVRSLQRGHTNTIGLCSWSVETEVEHSITMQFLKGISDSLASANQDILMYQWSPTRNSDAMINALMDGRVDGVILYPAYFAPSDILRLSAAELPIVTVYDDTLKGLKGTVNIDNRAGIFAAIDHLVALGHRRIAYVGPTESYDFSQRFTAYRQRLMWHGISPDPELWGTVHHLTDPIGPTCERFLALPSPPTAILAANDQLAFRWIKELENRGVCVPNHCSVIGFDDAPGNVATRRLTTIRNPVEQVGQTAAQFVCQMIQGTPASECEAVLPVEFVPGDTTAVPHPNTKRPPLTVF